MSDTSISILSTDQIAFRSQQAQMGLLDVLEDRKCVRTAETNKNLKTALDLIEYLQKLKQNPKYSSTAKNDIERKLRNRYKKATMISILHPALSGLVEESRQTRLIEELDEVALDKAHEHIKQIIEHKTISKREIKWCLKFFRRIIQIT